MSKLGLIVVAVLLIPFILLAGCSSNAASVQAVLGKDFTLPVGQTAVFSSENISLKFDSVSNDSRCPTGAQCIRAGEAVCRIIFTRSDNTTASIDLTELGLTSVPQQTTWTSRFGDFMRQYLINFTLVPYPEVNKQITPGDYQLQLNITRSL
jgi:hypothetical protein